jgi:4-amino-4-deoxy-L-arabinose transferase-like glycosyltransferase
MIGKNKARAWLISPATAVVALTVAGLAVRLYALGERGFWFDEVAFAYVTRLSTLDDLIAHINLWADHTPLSFFLVWLVRGLGADEATVRLPFALAGALGVPSLYLLGKALAGPRVGFLAALLLALSPFAVFYSQDVHPYAPLMLFTTLQVLFAYRAAIASRPLDWIGLALFTLLNLYNAYLTLALAAAVALFLGAIFLGRLVGVIPTGASPSTTTPQRRMLLPQLAAMSATALAVAILYMPWLQPTLTFLRAPVRTFYTTQASGVSFDDVRTLAHGLGFDKFLVTLLIAGALYAVFSLVRERRVASLLLLVWVGATLGGMWWLVGDRLFLLQARYFSFLLPAALILIALGADQIATRAASLYARLRARRAGASAPTRSISGAAFATVVALLLALAIPSLINSYSWTKTVPQDYRGAVARMIADGGPGSIVVSIGMWGLKPAPNYAFMVQGIEHYMWLRGSPMRYLDASLLDEKTVATLTEEDAIVWGAWALPWPIDPQHLQRASDMGLEVIKLEGVMLVRGRAPRPPPAQQLDTLLAWGIDPQPGLVATRALINPAYKASALGDNLLPPLSDVVQGEGQPDKWALRPNTYFDPGNAALALTSPDPQGETSITLSTRKLIPGATYVLLCHYSNTQLMGTQRVYLSTYAESGQLIETFPYGSGFFAAPGSSSGSAFAFKVPPTATNALLWLRITGQGTATFTGVEIRPVLGDGRR